MSWLFRRGLIARASSGGYCECSVRCILSLGTMMEDDLCLSLILGRSALDFREIGLEDVCCSDSEPLDAVEEALEVVGDRLGRSRVLYDVLGSGNAAVACVGDNGLDMICLPKRDSGISSSEGDMHRLRSAESLLNTSSRGTSLVRIAVEDSRTATCALWQLRRPFET